MIKNLVSILLIFVSLVTGAQTIVPDLAKVNDETVWKTFNRNATTLKENGSVVVALDARQGDGLAVFKNLEFENGTIEFDIKGKDVMQRSFVGIAFHIQDENTFNAVYFRPFNFKKPERSGHSVQYISHPEYTWQKLRTDFPEQFENPVTPIPDPDKWFHARVEVNWPIVKVFVENSAEPSLEVKMKSTFQKGKVGFWVGNGSDGRFKNLSITPRG